MSDDLTHGPIIHIPKQLEEKELGGPHLYHKKPVPSFTESVGSHVIDPDNDIYHEVVEGPAMFDFRKPLVVGQELGDEGKLTHVTPSPEALAASLMAFIEILEGCGAKLPLSKEDRARILRVLGRATHGQ